MRVPRQFCLDLICALGAKEHIFVGDSKGIITSNRANLDESKQRYTRDTEAKTLSDVIEGADMFLGLSAAGMLTQDMVKRMAQDPIIFALSNPNPEILPEDAKRCVPMRLSPQVALTIQTK